MGLISVWIAKGKQHLFFHLRLLFHSKWTDSWVDQPDYDNRCQRNVILFIYLFFKLMEINVELKCTFSFSHHKYFNRRPSLYCCFRSWHRKQAPPLIPPFLVANFSLIRSKSLRSCARDVASRLCAVADPWDRQYSSETLFRPFSFFLQTSCQNNVAAAEEP